MVAETEGPPAGRNGGGATGRRAGRGSAGSGKAAVGRTRVVFLGGVGEIGRNMTLFEHDDKILVLDTGLMFPTEEMLGVDLVLPDFTYLRERKRKVVGVVLTHGHEDHIGGVPYLLREMNPPIFGTKLTLGLLRGKLDEHHLTEKARLREIRAPGRLSLGPFRLRFLQVCHSIPAGVGTVIGTPAGTVLHMGDWNLDPTPVDGRTTDVAGVGEGGRGGVGPLLSDFTHPPAARHPPAGGAPGGAPRGGSRPRRGAERR